MPTTAITSTQILDSTSLGRDLITAADQAAAQTLLGITGVDVTAAYNWTGMHTFADDITHTASFIGSNIETDTLTVNGDLYAQNGCEFSGSVEFTQPFTAVGGEHQGNLNITQGSDLIISGAGKLDTSSITSSSTLNVDVSDFVIIKHSGSTSFIASSSAFYSNNTKTLGTTSKPWGTFYGSDAELSGAVTISGIATLEDELHVTGLLQANSTEVLTITVTDDIYANNAEFSGAVEFSGTVTTDSIVGSASAEGIKFDTNYGYLTSSNQGANVLRWSGSSVEVYGEMNPRYDSISNFGSDSTRWLKGYFDEGDFSGVIKATGGLDIDSGQMHIKHAGSFRMGIGGAGIFMYEDVLPNYSTITNGTSTKRWGNTYSVDGSFSGNLVSEAGGSYKIYNLGAEGDTDTEYLETSWNTNTASIFNKTTGSGTLRELTVGNADNRFRFTSAGVICAVNSVTKLNIGSNFTYLGSSVAVLPDTDGTIELGRSTARWQNVASVDGSFSGNLLVGVTSATTGTHDSEIHNRLLLKTTSSRAFTVRDNNSAEVFNINASQGMVTVNDDLSVGNNLTSEVGGSYKIYSLGADGDTDTEYLEISHNGDEFRLNSLATGSGTAQPVAIGRTNAMSMIHNGSGGTKTRTIYPQANDVYGLGISNIRYAYLYTVDANFSGTVTSNNFSGDGTGSIFIEEPSTNPIYVKHNGAVSYGLFNTAFRPGGTGTIELGLSTNRWENVYSVAGDFSDDVTVGGELILSDATVGKVSSPNADLELFVEGARLWRNTYNEAEFHRNRIRPGVDAGSDLGSSTYQWGNVYSVDGNFSGVLNTDEVNSDTLLKVGGSVGVAYRGLELDTTNGTLKWKYNNIAKFSVNSTTCTIGTTTLVANDVRADNIRPLADDTYALGESGFRWSDVHSVDGSFSGNLVSEAGGSYKHYNLGTEGDTDTEFYEASFDGNIYKMYSKATGSGAEPQVEFGSTDCQINVKPAFNQAVIRTGGVARLVAENASVWVSTNFRPSSDGLIALGTTSQRWSNVYSVEGNFSGTITNTATTGYAATFDRGIRVGAESGIGWYYGNGNQTKFSTPIMFESSFQFARAADGIASRVYRMAKNASKFTLEAVDGGVNGNTIFQIEDATDTFQLVRTGGYVHHYPDNVGQQGYRMYNLGEHGDTDTEFGGFNWVGNAFQIGTYKVGSGTSRNLQFMVGDGTRLYLSSNALTTYTNVAPSSDGSHNLGSATKAYARAFTNATFNSLQTITAATDSLSTTDTTNLCDCTSNAIEITIPSGSTSQVGNEYVIKKIDSSANAVTITATGATIDGAATKTLSTQYETAKLVSDGTNWFLI